MSEFSRRQLLRYFWLCGLSYQADAIPIGGILGNQNPQHARFVALRYWDWYQKEFFPFQKHLAQDEQGLIKQGLASLPNWNELFSPMQGIDRFLVSHRLQGGHATHGRVAIHVGAELQAAMRTICKRQGVSASFFDQGGQVYGLGWDCDADLFKIYLRYDSRQQIQNQSIKSLEKNAAHESEGDFYPVRFSSLRFKRGQLLEKRLYRVARGISSAVRGIAKFGPHILQVTQIFSDQGLRPAHWRLLNFPSLGLPEQAELAFIKQEKEFRFAADSVRYQDPQNITVYYP
ncbi:MAG: hypothetical protein AB7N80_08540 [Bdellovibrionales bacterium]